ncbi:hypothetical protein Nisw_08740 [Candidatus Nitrosopumilus sp. SW]|uniref:hypothetical protein n=1 Tax=Candidatus Nitrosopumilus sp. SW TaxID=2508726 RepID=UPI00114D682F|nr:hypothetical protein [Candidatus Nitrosopumilus sp. SW]QDI89599.1 hypothetical protein Nisw_08740 [Candidatus Nitrosopumilus sp. SW]
MTSNGKKNSANVSCRIDKTIYDELLLDAEKKGISLNSLISSIAKHHVTWKRYADEMGFVPITKRLIGKIFKNLDQKTIESIAHDLGGTVPRELLFMTFDKMDFENFMQILEINAMRFGSVKHTHDDGVHVLNIHHGISDEFSHFLACAHQKMADDLSLKINITNSDKNMLCLNIEKPTID